MEPAAPPSPRSSGSATDEPRLQRFSKLRAWIQAFRPLGFGNVFPPLLYGQMLAACVTGRFLGSALAVSVVLAVTAQAYILFLNDVGDLAADQDNTTPTFLSGGSRVLVEGKLTPAELLRGAHVAAIVAAVTTLGSAWLFTPWVLPAAAVGSILPWLYGFPPARLAYRSNGEVVQAVGLGLVLPYWGYVLHAGSPVALPWAALLPPLALGYAGNVATALPDLDADRRAQKRTVAVRTSPRFAQVLCIGIVTAAVLGAPWLLPGALPLLSWLWYAPILPCVIAVAILLRAGQRGVAPTVPFVTATLAAITTALLIWSFLLATHMPAR